MKLSWKWLGEFVPGLPAPEETAAVLRRLGFDTVAVTPAGGPVVGVVAARVETAVKHPGADRLRLCKVFDGTTTWEVVCGAPNAAPGLIAPLARVGARLPDGTQIENAVIRGQASQGMMCSARELGLGADHAGLLELPADTTLGRDVVSLLDLDDVILEVEVTPNRPDALSHWGMARELAAGLGKPPILLPEGRDDLPALADLVKVESPDCDYYRGVVLEGVAVRPAPLRARLRLERCGIRAIVNLVDVTNYVLLEWGHPLHVFDRDKLAQGRVVVRPGETGESLACLDGVTRSVAGHVVVADVAGPAALAGVMGGAAVGVGPATTRVLLESARFTPSSVRRARRTANVSTESSYRFERGTDVRLAERASRRAVELLLAWGGGKAVGIGVVGRGAVAREAVPADVKKINGLLGTSFSSAEVKDSLTRLGFAVRGEGENLSAVPPAHRRDVKELPDVAEEVARVAGYDRLPARLRGAEPGEGTESRETALVRTAREFFTAQGFWEAVSHGLAARSRWEALAGPTPVVEVDNPISQEGDILAPSLLPALLGSAALNLRRGEESPRFFEVARVFAPGEKAVVESLSIAWVALGGQAGEHWKFKSRPLEFWDAKAWAKGFLKEIRSAGVRFAPGAPGFLHPGQSQIVLAGEKPLGFFGRLHPGRARALDLPEDVFVGELDLTALAGVSATGPAVRPLPRHPALRRDFSLVFPETVAWSTVALGVMKLSDWVEDVALFDVYRGAGLPEGRRSLAFRVTWRHPERTLTDAEAAGLQEKIMTHFRAAHGAEPRT
jgi:phenylalanyl-tRNA synthetase beta chain